MNEAPRHPGEILRDTQDELGISQVQLALSLAFPRPKLADVLLGRRPVTPELALRLAQLLEVPDDHWLRLQNEYDLALERERVGRFVANILTLSERRELGWPITGADAPGPAGQPHRPS